MTTSSSFSSANDRAQPSRVVAHAHHDTQRRVNTSLAAGITIIGAAASTYVYSINPNKPTIIPACPFHALTGGWCPGCGATRALHELLHGNVTNAIAFNSLFVLSLPLITYLIARQLLPLVFPKLQPKEMDPKISWYIQCLAGIAVIAFFVLRNIPLVPFSYLAPHSI